ncbi:MFS transporter [Alkaliphilus serpentinus]|uniref:MFS transporter n=1 Tax=Alkaliphilus serpentinus TaxID=1482731 RepID=A0A833HP70_9FIRM|nr:MFS transporter [Alkaliphilus serpentinus]KAB3530451.1 MFS transporter [Alkaliphilus serpentinus]
MDLSKRKWSIWTTLVIAFITVFFHRMAISVMADDLIRDLNLTGKTLGNLTSMNFYAYALMQIPVGIMVDTIGVRKISSLGMLITGIGSILFGFSSTISMAYIARFMVGLGTSVIIVSIIKVQTIWFRREQFSTLSGFTSLSGNLGALLATFPLAYLVMGVGWRKSFQLMGVMSLIMALAIWLIVKEKPDGEADKKKAFSFESITNGLKTVITNPYTWPPFAIMFLMVGSMTAILGLWGVPYLMHVYDMSKAQAAGNLSLVAIGFMLGGPMVGYLSDFLKGEIKRILFAATGLFTFIWAFIAMAGGKPNAVYLPIIFFMLGVTTICHILAFTNVKDVNPDSLTGSAAAIINVGEFVGGSLLSFLIGVFLDYGWGGTIQNGTRIYSVDQYQKVFIAIAIIGFFSMISTLLMKGKEKKVNIIHEEGSLTL